MIPKSRITFDPAGDNIILITYPPGGFGNFVYHLLTEFAKETAKPSNHSFKFSNAGNSHTTKKYTVSYTQSTEVYFPYIDVDVDTSDKKILVLVDNEWKDNYYNQLLTVFPNAKIVRMCSDPTIYNIVAALIASKSNGAPIDLRFRENYSGAGMFNPIDHAQVVNVPIKEFILDPNAAFLSLLAQLQLTPIKHNELLSLLSEWKSIHKPYFEELYKEFHKAHLL